jgi:hypothetical protein
MAYNRRDDDLAYGDYHGQGEGQEGDRGFVGDMGRRLFGGGRKEVRPQSTKRCPVILHPAHIAHDSSWLEANCTCLSVTGLLIVLCLFFSLIVHHHRFEHLTTPISCTLSATKHQSSLT